MVKALNYPAAAARGLRQWLDEGRQGGVDPALAADYEACQRLLALLEHPDCQHFQLPDGGHFFNDKLKGIQGKPVRLPYPLISISYHCPMPPGAEETFDGSKLVHVPRRVAVAIEMGRDALAPRHSRIFPGCERICMVMALFNTATAPDLWRPCASVALMPTDKWDGTGYEGETIDPPTFMKEPGGVAFMGKISIMLPGFHQETIRNHGKDWAARSACYDIGGEGAAVLELCEALTCSNVKQHVIQRANPRLNARRAREGHLPFLETKVLTVVVPKPKGASPYRGGTHDSPGFHLCSGHIRSWPNDPTRNIWIEDYARGDRAKGEIRKTYKVVDGHETS
jgi:hypothetical protein